MAYISASDLDTLIPAEISAEIIQEAAEGSVIMRKARRLRDMSKNTMKMPVLEAFPMAYFVDGEPSDLSGKQGYKTTTKAEWEGKNIYAGEIQCIVPVKENDFDDADIDLWTELKPLIIESMGMVFDAAVLHGTNKPTNWPTGIVTAAIAAGNRVVQSADLYDDLMSKDGVIAKLEKCGYFPTGHIGGLSLRGELRGLRDDNGVPIFTNRLQTPGYLLDGSEIDFPLNGALDESEALLVTGAWNKLVYSMRKDVSYKILTESVIQDPTTKDIVYNLAQQDMIALRCTMRIGWQIPNPVNRIQPTAARRYPFAVLQPSASS